MKTFEHYFLQVLVPLAGTKVPDGYIEANYTLIYDSWMVNVSPMWVGTAIYNSFYNPEYDRDVTIEESELE
jgi:hypothetical protein